MDSDRQSRSAQGSDASSVVVGANTIQFNGVTTCMELVKNAPDYPMPGSDETSLIGSAVAFVLTDSGKQSARLAVVRVSAVNSCRPRNTFAWTT